MATDIARVSKISSTCIYLYFDFFKHVHTCIYFHYAVYVLVFNAHNLLGSLCMGNNATLHPIKLIGSCIQLIKLNCIIIKTTQADALLSIKGLVIKFSSTISCMVISVHMNYYLLFFYIM